MVNICVDIGATKTVIAIMSESGEINAFQKHPTSKVIPTSSSPIESLLEFLDKYIQLHNLNKKNIRGVGIGVPAVVNSQKEEIVSCPNIPQLNGVVLGKEIGKVIGIPVFIDNDVNLIALGEHSFGRGKTVDDLACIYFGTGLGCGLILNGNLYTGADGSAAEFGHMIFKVNGKKCVCGSLGCLEMYCSGRSIANDAALVLSENELRQGSNYGSWGLAENVIIAANQGNLHAQNLLENSFSALGWGVTNLVNLLNPRLVILGGGIVTGWPKGLSIVKGFVASNARRLTRDYLEIDYPFLGEKAGLFGAFVLIKDKLNIN